MHNRKADNPYLILTIILAFYLLSQIFQQYVLRLSSISNPLNEEQVFLFRQHWLNFARLGLILFSMFLMVIAWVIIHFHFKGINSFWNLSALLFMVLFCLFEIFYRSLELFMAVSVWGSEIIDATGEHRQKLLSQYAMFDSFVSAIYFPLLFSQLLGSLILVYLSGQARSWWFMSAMLLNTVRLVFRLSDYFGFPELNVFSDSWYFPPVALIFLILISWSYKEYRKSTLQRGN